NDLFSERNASTLGACCENNDFMPLIIGGKIYKLACHIECPRCTGSQILLKASMGIFDHAGYGFAQESGPFDKMLQHFGGLAPTSPFILEAGNPTGDPPFSSGSEDFNARRAFFIWHDIFHHIIRETLKEHLFVVFCDPTNRFGRFFYAALAITFLD